MMKKHYKKLLNRKALAATTKAIALTLLGAATLTACSPQAYVPSVIRTSASAPGSFYIPPKVDFLLAQDDTGSQLSVYNQVAAQMPGLLEEMEATGWDYHFATSVLSDRSRNSISQIAAGRYDLNWGSEWIAPFPGAPADASTMQVSPSFFRKAADFTDYLPASRVSNVSQGTENGLATVYDALSAKLSGTGFLRPDALLVVLTVSNGEDTSGVTYCDSYNRIIGDAKDELILPCEQTSFATSSNSTYSASLSYYESKLLELKSNSRALIRFYSAVSSRTRSGTSCLGSAAYKGDRYMRMASALGGESYDICTQSAASVLSDLKAQLDAIRGDFETGYLMVQEEPDLTTVEVIKYVGGDASQAIVIPQSETDGWSYAGYLEQVPLIDTPVAMNFATGYAIKLNGAARLQGSDTAKVSYKTAEGQVSATE
jgi:hypothetical protein